jgi:hypothetical protein
VELVFNAMQPAVVLGYPDDFSELLLETISPPMTRLDLEYGFHLRRGEQSCARLRRS